MSRIMLKDKDFLRELCDVIDDRVSETLEDYLAEGRDSYLCLESRL